MDYLLWTRSTGAGATAPVDVSAVVRKHLLGIAAPDYGLVGRWLAHMPLNPLDVLPDPES